MKRYGDLDPYNPADWGPSVSYIRQVLVPDTNMIAEISIGKKFGTGIVTSVKFTNQGDDSSVQVGRDMSGGFETISEGGAAEISFGEGFPQHIEDKFKVIFTATASPATHKVVVVMAVVNINC